MTTYQHTPPPPRRQAIEYDDGHRDPLTHLGDEIEIRWRRPPWHLPYIRIGWADHTRAASPPATGPGILGYAVHRRQPGQQLYRRRIFYVTDSDLRGIYDGRRPPDHAVAPESLGPGEQGEWPGDREGASHAS